MAADGGAPTIDHQLVPRPRHVGVVFAVLSIGVVSFGVLQSLLIPALPVIKDHLGTTQNSVSWVVTAYMLSAAVATPILGRLGDMFGKKHVLVFALGALCVGSLVGALAGSLTVMIVARVIQGLGGGVLPLVFSIIRDEFPASRVGSAIGAIAAMVAAGAGIGTVMSGVITESLGYVWLFWIPMIVVASAAVATVVIVPESPIRTRGKVNIVGAALLSGWLVALLVPISKGEQWGWSSGRVVLPILLAVVLLAAWIVVEWRAVEPLVDMRMMRERAVWATNLSSLVFGIVMAGYLTFLPQFVETPEEVGYGFGATVTMAGFFLLPGAIMSSLIGPFAGWLTARFGGKLVVAFGSLMSFFSTSLFATSHDSEWTMYVVAALSGAGVGAAFSAMSALIVTSVKPEQVGVATGMNANIRTIGSSIGVALMTTIVTTDPLPGGVPTEAGYTNGFRFLAGAAIVGLLAALLVKSGPARREVSQSPENAPIGALQGEPTS